MVMPCPPQAPMERPRITQAKLEDLAWLVIIAPTLSYQIDRVVQDSDCRAAGMRADEPGGGRRMVTPVSLLKSEKRGNRRERFSEQPLREPECTSIT